MVHKTKFGFGSVFAIAALLALILLAAASPVSAQDAISNTASNGSQWIGYFIFIIGLIAIGIIGFSAISRRGPRTAFMSNESDEELINDSDADLQ